MRIADGILSEIRSKTDIVSLVSEHVALRRVGASFRGLCPFHAEKTPSFYVHPARQYFHCFGCQASGDAIAFLERVAGYNFRESVEALADRVGIELQFDEGDPKKAGVDARVGRLRDILDTAAGFFMRQMQEHALGHFARDELKNRALTQETIDRFRLGYAPGAWDSLTQYLVGKQGFSPEDCVEVGLIVPKKNESTRYYDRFRHRLMFPIVDSHGRVVAFSGRTLPGLPAQENQDRETPKYINSPETAFYKKADTLYGLHEGRTALRKYGWAVLCEGNFDVIALHQADFANAVAPMGTAFTVSQAKLMRRHAERVVLLLDGDRAGRAATQAAHAILEQAGLEGRVAELPRGEDPDSFIRNKGALAMKHLLEAAVPIVFWMIDDAADRAAGEPQQKANAIKQLAPILKTVKSPVEMRLYIDRIQQRFQINDENAVRLQLRAGLKDTPKDSRSAPSPRPAPAKPSRENSLPEFERELLGALLDNPILLTQENAIRLFDLLTHELARDIFRVAQRHVVGEGVLDAAGLLNEMQGRAGVEWLSGRLAQEKFDFEAAKDTLERALAQLEQKHTVQRLQLLAKEAQDALRQGDVERATQLQHEHLELARGIYKTNSTRERALNTRS